MSVVNRNLIDRLKMYLPDYLSMKGIGVNKPFRCLNPKHEDKKPSMSYFEKGLNVHCFACGETYDLFDVIGIDYGINDFSFQIEKASSIFSMKKTSDLSKKESKNISTSDRTEQLEEMQKKGKFYPEYLLNRKITKESCNKYNIFQKDDRVYFPIYKDSICVGWCGRSILDGKTPKYKNSSGSLEIWNNKYVEEIGKNKELYITEGVIDAICLEQMGYNAVALCGSTNTEKFVNLCKENIKTAQTWEFVICGDPDDAGIKMNEEISIELTKLGLLSKTLYLKDNMDIADLYLEGENSLGSYILDEKFYISPKAEKYNLLSSSSYIDDFFSDRKKYSKLSKISTGFDNLNNVLDGGLYPAFYVIGSVASLGKTSFILQIADQLSKQGHDVMFFTLEQSKQELLAKSISRISAQLDISGNAFTAREILSGKDMATIQEMALLDICKKKYTEISKGLFIFEGIGDIGTEKIKEKVQEHIRIRGKKPILIIDYLQILKPHDMRSTDKQNVDRSVVDLKIISRDLHIPIIAVSSFNRENYKTEVSMEAFKESGAVEYSADVLFGLQLKGTGRQGFNINTEKSREPRQIELVMLKNRNGAPYAKIDLEYSAKYSLFREN